MNSFGQMIHQGFIGGGVGEVHVISGVHNAIAEVVTPDTVDDRFGEVRVFSRSEPRHQCIARVSVQVSPLLFRREFYRRESKSVVIFLVLRFAICACAFRCRWIAAVIED